jgi:hypothetical protein
MQEELKMEKKDKKKLIDEIERENYRNLTFHHLLPAVHSCLCRVGDSLLWQE